MRMVEEFTSERYDKKKALTKRPAPPSFNYSAYLQPEQDSQQSAEGQHDVFAAFTVPARPSATTAINTITLMFFMDFLL